MRIFAAIALFLFSSINSHALADEVQELAELFGRGPVVSDAEMTPDGKLFAFTKHQNGRRYIVVYSLEEGVVRGFDATGEKLHGYYFLDNKHLIINKSLTTSFPGYRGDYEMHGAFAANVETGDAVQLLSGAKDLTWPQINLGMTIGPSPRDRKILMMARFGQNPNDSPFNLVRVDLKTGRSSTVKRGNSNTIDWFVDDQENVYAREDYSNKTNKHVIRVLRDGKWSNLFKDETEVLDVRFVALSDDLTSLVAIDEVPNLDAQGLFEVSLADGSWSAPKFVQDGKTISHVLESRGKAYGVVYDGMRPSYAFYDEALTESFETLLTQFPNTAISIMDVTRDRSQFLLEFSGPDTAGRVFVFWPKERRLAQLIDFYSNLPADKFATASIHTVRSRDGLKFPTKLTLPLGVSNPTNLPAVVYPHGGPASLDKIGFDDFAQYFANLGYVVIQPNFRGSEGLGIAFERAGDGEWGREMQDDVTDALQHFIDTGLVDPNRVCIAGHSYGGYSALAGGAYTPDLYKCVIAAGAVSDLPKMLSDESRSYGKDHWVIAYWNRVIGDRKEKREELKSVSPARSAEAFKAPTLLIHGDDDTVVPIGQSRRMKNALQKADKDVTFVRVKKMDHWYSDKEHRVQVMAEMGAFLREHLGE